VQREPRVTPHAASLGRAHTLSPLHGLIFTTFEDFFAARFPTLDVVRGRFRPDEAYPDAELFALLDRASALAEEPRDELLREFGKFTALETFVRLFPRYYESCRSLREFLLGIEEQIHDVVRATITGAAPPRLRVTPFGTTGVVVSYTSERGLCALLEGLVLGSAAYYGEEVEVEQTQCMRRGDPACAVLVDRAR